MFKNINVLNLIYNNKHLIFFFCIEENKCLDNNTDKDLRNLNTNVS
jgi:hypothetical protein